MSDKFETKLGRLLNDNDGARDAIHIATIPVRAACLLKPGERVSIIKYEKGDYWVGKGGKTVGIVDPFLLLPVKYSQRFYLCLIPYTISYLRHAWEHPAFNLENENDCLSKKEKAKKKLDEYANTLGIKFNEFLDLINGEKCLNDDTPDWLCNVKQDIIDNYNIYTDSKLRYDDVYFSCSC